MDSINKCKLEFNKPVFLNIEIFFMGEELRRGSVLIFKKSATKDVYKNCYTVDCKIIFSQNISFIGKSCDIDLKDYNYIKDLFDTDNRIFEVNIENFNYFYKGVPDSPFKRDMANVFLKCIEEI